MSAFHHILYGGIPDKFPLLRFGFIEAAAGWVPYVLTDVRRRLVREGRRPLSDTPLRDNRLYVAVQTNDDLPYVLHFAGEDNLVIGSDYGHSDTASELEALKNLQATSGLPPVATRKILDDNPRALYGL
jgi:predicted TIM-barrel fold metal-dependent hydrolase